MEPRIFNLFDFSPKMAEIRLSVIPKEYTENTQSKRSLQGRGKMLIWYHFYFMAQK
jgi:hypothetical protein